MPGRKPRQVSLLQKPKIKRPKKIKKRVRKITEKRVGFFGDVFARFAEGEKAPRSYKKITHPNEIETFKYLKSRGIALPEFKVIGKNLYIRAAGKEINIPDLSRKDKKEIASQLAKQLGKMHSAGIAHGDIKLGNVVWNKKNRKAFLIDFDYAKRKKINWQTATTDKIIKVFNKELWTFTDYIMGVLGAPKKEEHISMLIEQYPISKKKKQELVKKLAKRYKLEELETELREYEQGKRYWRKKGWI